MAQILGAGQHPIFVNPGVLVSRSLPQYDVAYEDANADKLTIPQAFSHPDATTFATAKAHHQQPIRALSVPNNVSARCPPTCFAPGGPSIAASTLKRNHTEPDRRSNRRFHGSPPAQPVQTWSPPCQLVGMSSTSAQPVNTAATEPPQASHSNHQPHEKPSTGAKKHWSTFKPTREPHNLVERRYRENLNGQLEELRNSLPAWNKDQACQAASNVEECWPTAVKLPSKAAVISTARAYIKDLEAGKARLSEENRLLREQVAGLQKLVKCDDCSVINYLASVHLQQGFDPAGMQEIPLADVYTLADD